MAHLFADALAHDGDETGRVALADHALEGIREIAQQGPEVGIPVQRNPERVHRSRQFALLTHRYSLGLQAVLSGETKGKDTQRGERLADTGITALYVGPGLTFTWGTSLAADVAFDLPAVQDNTAVQIVPDYRVRGGLTWRF